MTNLNKVIIGDNRIKFYDEILKVSNISRTWVFKYQNIEKRKFQEQVQVYQKAKAQYEANETQKKKESIRNALVGAVIFLLIAMFCSFISGAAGFLFLCITGICIYAAFMLYKEEIIYPFGPPVEKSFPDKFGLGIQMNSGHTVTFTAIGKDGVDALRDLQNKIEEADVNKGIIYFNLGDNNITLENKDCIISTGDFANNVYHKEEEENL